MNEELKELENEYNLVKDEVIPMWEVELEQIVEGSLMYEPTKQIIEALTLYLKELETQISEVKNNEQVYIS